MASVEAAYHLSNQNGIVRQVADFPASIWGDRFTSFNLDKKVYEMHAKEIETLNEEVRSMLLAPENTVMETLNLIDTIERLGISYHFEKEIEHKLQEIFNSHANLEDYPKCDLFDAALKFRLLRQHGFNISCGIFNQYMNASGKFKKSLSNDLKGLLNLFDAVHVRAHKDTILEEALAFTIPHLKRGAQEMTSSLEKQVNHALVQPLHRGIPIIESRQYISIYEEDESKNCSLLRLAKLNFNLLQMIYKQELSELLRWWKELDIESKLPFSRDRSVECYFWAMGCFSEPKYSLSRNIFTKIAILLTKVDDTYDAYGTLDELKAFTDAVERWDAKEADGLPDYMKAIYMALLSCSKWVDNLLTKEGRCYAFSKYKEEMKQYARTSYTQAQWFLTRELPTFPDYFKNGLVTSGYYALTTTAFSGMECGTKDVFDWLSSNPKNLSASATICRLVNDIASYEAEKERSATAIECYMKHYKVSEEEAMKELEQMAENAWKDINEEFLKPNAKPRESLMGILNLTRMIDVVYKHREDGFTNPHKVLEPHIIAVLADPIIV